VGRFSERPVVDRVEGEAQELVHLLDVARLAVRFDRDGLEGARHDHHVPGREGLYEVSRYRLSRLQDSADLVGAVLVADAVSLDEIFGRRDEAVDLARLEPRIGVCLSRCLEDQLPV